MKLNAVLNLLEGRIEDEILERSGVDHVFSQWRDRRAELELLLHEFTFAMSPQSLFCEPPLNLCDIETRKWLAPTAHWLWTQDEAVQSCVAQAKFAASAADQAFCHLDAMLASEGADRQSVEAIRPFRAQFSQCRDRCQDLAEALSRLPNDVRIR